MLTSLLLASALQVGPFFEKNEDEWALRPLVSQTEEVTDVLWPVFTSHRDWWRFAYLLNYQSHGDGGYQFSIPLLWWNGRVGEEGPSYAGLFPLYGHHPGMLAMYDLDFALWPLWMAYSRPQTRNGERQWLRTNTVLFPFFSWRNDGAWSFWPLYGVNYQRESTHRYALWPLVTWASYEADHDTSGAGYSYCVWPFYGQVRREREEQDLYLPPFFSYVKTPERVRYRLPWPLFDYEKGAWRNRLSVWPFYERDEKVPVLKRDKHDVVTRFGWKLVEIYDDEVRVFPFYVGGNDYTRVWPFWESETIEGETHSRVLALFPVRWVPAVMRNWAKFWIFYEQVEKKDETEHSLFWGLIRWTASK